MVATVRSEGLYFLQIMHMNRFSPSDGRVDTMISASCFSIASSRILGFVPSSWSTDTLSRFLTVSALRASFSIIITLWTVDRVSAEVYPTFPAPIMMMFI